MTSRKTKGKASRREELSKRQNQRLEKRGDSAITTSRSVISLEIRPKVGPSERVEDSAVFNKDCRLKISEELQIEATNVGEALELTSQGKFEDALGKLKDIGRSSPLSDWRLFVRGLQAFYSGDLETARQNWTRLDRTRRPARIATTLLLAEAAEPLEGDLSPVSELLVEHAKTLRLRKNAVDSALAIAKVKHRNPDTTFSVSQSAMLSTWINEFRKLDLEFVSRVGHACMSLAMDQGDMEVFDRLVKVVPGAANDPRWNRTRMLYALKFEGAQSMAEKASIAYLEQDLPKLSHLPEQLRDALACKIFLIRAELKISSNERSYFPFSFREPEIDSKRIDDLLRKAIQRYPSYRLAHERLVNSLESQVDNYRVSKSEQEKLEKQLIIAKEQLVRNLPDDVETTLELIDFYLDEDQLEKANALVKQLGGQRLEDPLAKALPWKLKLREAMRLSRRKTDLLLADKALDEAETLWPTWLNRNWLPFLRAGIALRRGDQAKFTELTVAARKEQMTSDFVGEVMTFAALQQMNIPSTDLKPFRTVVENQAENASKIELADLFSIGSFFWDLVRTGLKHKGYRLQASKFGRAFADKIKSQSDRKLTATQMDAYSWGAHHRFWPLGNDYTPTPTIKKLAMNEPRMAAVVLAWLTELDHFPDYRMVDYEPLITLAQEAARSEKDAFYRYMFDTAADDANDIISEAKAKNELRKTFGSGSNYDDNDEFYDDDDDDEDDEYEDEDESDDDRCDCPNCRAKRARLSGSFFEEDEDLEDEDNLDDEVSSVPAIVGRVFLKLGPTGMVALHHIVRSISPQDEPDEFLQSIGHLFPNHGLSMMDAVEFVMALRNDIDKLGLENLIQAKVQDKEIGAQPSPTMTAEERKAVRKQREKELEKKKREASRSGSRK